MGAGPHGTPIPGPACSELIGALDNHPLSRLLWRRLKPLILGKLLFAPDTPFTRKLMAQVGVAWMLGQEGGSQSPSSTLSPVGQSQARGSWKLGLKK